MKIAILILLAVLGLYGKNVKDNPIQRLDLKDGTSLLRVHFNYLNAFKTTQKVRGLDGIYSINFPLPNKWKIIEADGYIKYTPSILLLKNLSSAIVSFNDVIVSQFKIFDNKNSGIKFNIDPSLFYKNNTLQFEAIQHYTLNCENGANSALWSNLDLAHSYIELHVRPKPIKEFISSIKSDVFDDKQYALTPLNFVVDKKDDQSLKNLALFTSVASTNLKYRLERIKVSNKIDKKNHNLIIATKEKALSYLKRLGNYYITDDRPSLSLFFNSNSCDAWLNRSKFAHVVPDKNIKIIAKGAFYDKSLYLNKNRVTLKHLKVNKTNSATVAFWFKPEYAGHAVLFGFDTYSLILVNGYLGFNTANKDLYGTKYKFQKNKWYHITATFHNGAVERNTILVDGRVQHLKQISNNFVSDNARLSTNAYIGGLKSEKTYYKGYIDQFYMFDYALTTISAKKLYRYSLEHKRRGATESLYMDDKIAHDINIIQNPYKVDKAIIVLIAKDKIKKEKLIYALYKNDLVNYKRQGLNIKEVTIPSKASAYSAKNFIPLDTKIYFNELGYKTQFLKGWYPPKIDIKFKVYPDNHFDAKDKIKANIHYVLPTVVNDDSVVNIFLNNIFANQLNIMKMSNESEITISANKLFNFGTSQGMPAYLIGKGYNDLRLDFSLVPKKKGACSVFNTENLVASVLDDSYFILPSATKWIELPYMQYIIDAQYPYSIYPDLQDTVILLADRQNDTIASAMNFIFFLAQALDSYPNFLKVTTALSQEDKQKHIIVFGTIYDDKIQSLSKTAPIVFDKNRMTKNYPYINRFIEHETILNKDRLKKYRFLTSMQETNLVDSSIIMQMSRSPYNSDKTVLMFAANTPKCLNKGVNSLFKYKNRNNILGDTLIYDYEDEEGVAYNIKDKYILSHLNWFQSLALYIGANPIRYLIFFIIFLIIFVWIVRTLLRKFKEEHHPDAEEPNGKNNEEERQEEVEEEKQVDVQKEDFKDVK